jgi:hypothetical protein
MLGSIAKRTVEYDVFSRACRLAVYLYVSLDSFSSQEIRPAHAMTLVTRARSVLRPTCACTLVLIANPSRCVSTHNSHVRSSYGDQPSARGRRGVLIALPLANRDRWSVERPLLSTASVHVPYETHQALLGARFLRQVADRHDPI